MFFFSAAAEHHVLIAPAALLRGRADAMRARGAGRGHRVAHALDAKCGGETRGDRTAHRARHACRAHLADATLAEDIGGLDDVRRRRATAACDQAGEWIADLR